MTVTANRRMRAYQQNDHASEQNISIKVFSLKIGYSVTYYPMLTAYNTRSLVHLSIIDFLRNFLYNHLELIQIDENFLFLIYVNICSLIQYEMISFHVSTSYVWRIGL